MLDAKSSLLQHALQNLFLIALSVFFIPLNTFILISSLLLTRKKSKEQAEIRAKIRNDSSFRPRRILITGISMTKGLSLARLFHQAGHDVVGADFTPGGALPCGIVSKSIVRFHRLSPPEPQSGSVPYISSLLSIIRREHIDLWVSCSGVASAIEDGLAMEAITSQTQCATIQFDASTTQTLHEKHSFISHTQSLGLTTPETHHITSPSTISSILHSAPPSHHYILKPIGVDDSARGDMTLLPLATTTATSQHISHLQISPSHPWILQQYIEGEEFCTHALVVQGEVRCFVACPSAELLMQYRALPARSPLSLAMLNFTRVFARSRPAPFTGHLSFDFLVERNDLLRLDWRSISLYPIECNPRAHTAVVLFRGMASDLSHEYLRVVDEEDQGEGKTYAEVVDEDLLRGVVTPGVRTVGMYYWSGHDLVNLLLLPLLEVLMMRMSVLEFVAKLDELLDHLVCWSDGTFEDWDPLPWWWLYHVYWPLRFWDMLRRGQRWSRVNVSTGKMFEC